MEKPHNIEVRVGVLDGGTTNDSGALAPDPFMDAVMVPL